MIARRPPAFGSWLSSLWHKAGPEIAAAAAVASGQPELALPAAQAASAAGGGRPNPPKPTVVVQAPAAVQPPTGGFLQAYETLNPLDKQVVAVGGAVLGAVILARVLFPPSQRR